MAAEIKHLVVHLKQNFSFVISKTKVSDAYNGF